MQSRPHKPNQTLTALTTQLLLLAILALTVNAAMAQNAERFAPNELLRLHLVWHLDATAEIDIASSELPLPTVRNAVTQAFFPVLSRLTQVPDAPATLCISSETLMALVRYTHCLREFIDLSNNTIDAQGFLKKYGGKTDAWLDILLKPSAELTSRELDMLLNISKTQPAHGFSVSERILRRFPDYARLLPSDMKVGSITGSQNRALYTIRDRIRIKFFYTIAHFDPALLTQKLVLPLSVQSGKLTALRTRAEQPLTIDLSDYFMRDDNQTPDESDDRYDLIRPIGEDDCQRLVVETYKMMEAILFWLRQSNAVQASGRGAKERKKAELMPAVLSLDVITTPAFNALVPLLINSESAQEALSEPAEVPLPIQASSDAKAHLVRALTRTKSQLGIVPQGLVPTALMVSESSIELYESVGISWVLAPKAALAKALSVAENALSPKDIAGLYRLSSAKGVLLSFEETVVQEALQQALTKPNRSEALMLWRESLERYRGAQNVLTVRIKLPQTVEGVVSATSALTDFLNALTTQSKAKKERNAELVRLSALLAASADKKKNIEVKTLAKLPLAAEAPIEQWIGDAEEKLAWTYLALARADLERTKLPPPSVEREPVSQDSETLQTSEQAWFELYAAEQAFWFKQYGREAKENDAEMQAIDRAFRTHLNRIYEALTETNAKVERRRFVPIVAPEERAPLRPLKVSEIQLDGMLSESEWFENAGVFVISEAEMPISKCYYGTSNDALYLALVANQDLATLLRDTTKKLALIVAFEENQVAEFELRPTAPRNGGIKAAFTNEAAEIVVPYTELKLPNQIGFLGTIAGQARTHNKDAYLGIAIIWRNAAKAVRVPKENFKTVQEDLINTVEAHFELDLSASPATKSAELEMLRVRSKVRQKVVLRDDGRQGDEKRNDKIWTAVLRLQRGELIEYRYVADGQAEQLEQWRTWRVEDGVNTPNRAVVRDVFNKTLR